MAHFVLRDREVRQPFLVRLFGITEQEFEELADEETRAELYDGVMIVHSPTTWRHDDLQLFLASLMRVFADFKRLGNMTGPNTLMRLAQGRKFAPDIMFVAQHRVPTPLTKEFEGAADLVVEILSESTRQYDLIEKRQVYQEAGIREIFFIDSENRKIIIDRRQATGRYQEEIITAGKVTSSVLQGFWFEAEWLWQEPLPPVMECLEQLLPPSSK
ncbi:Uma2 family endonuclease [Candidatus Acetothermia bacterium]|nr:Uma2 family endonuclease [Candidatus Acetothermia bacterium]